MMSGRSTTRILIAAGAFGLVALAAGSTAAETAATSQSGAQGMEQMKRRPPQVAPLVVGGVRYEVTYVAPGIDQASGLLMAVDEATGKTLWTVAVYPVAYEDGEERDAQEVFITDLAPGADDQHVIVTDQDGKRYSVRTSDGSAEPIPES